MMVLCNNPHCKFNRKGMYEHRNWCATDKITLQLYFPERRNGELQSIDNANILDCCNFEQKEE